MSFFSSLTTLAFFSLPENGFCLALSAALPAQQSCLMDFPAPQRLNTQKSYSETDREVIHVLLKLFVCVCCKCLFINRELRGPAKGLQSWWDSVWGEKPCWGICECGLRPHTISQFVCRECVGVCVCVDPLPWSFWRTCRLKRKSLNACSIKMEIQQSICAMALSKYAQ